METTSAQENLTSHQVARDLDSDIDNELYGDNGMQKGKMGKE